MPCHAKATSVSSRRRFSSLRTSPPPVAAVLDMAKPGERTAHDLLRRFSTGRWPTWRPLAMRRAGQALLVAVEWSPRALRSPRTYSLVALSLDEPALSWRNFPSAPAAQRACKVATAHTAGDATAARGHG